jgi:hypothetical protein
VIVIRGLFDDDDDALDVFEFETLLVKELLAEQVRVPLEDSE